jgi:hypothetical protein
MLRTVILAACFCALACLSSVAEARPGRHHFPDVGNMVGCSDPVMRPCGTGGARPRGRFRAAPVAVRARYARAPTGHSAATLRRPARYIAGRLVCAINVNAELARRGIRGTGSALAESFLHWGRPSRPVAGAVAVYGRRGGGHVAIVSRVVGGRVYVWNPSSRAHRWREVEYRGRAIAYRVAGQ